jgi:hypothetical protein
MVARGAGLDAGGFRVDAAGTVLARMAWPRAASGRAALGGYPASSASSGLKEQPDAQWR